MNSEQSSCRLLHCPLGSKRQWVLLGIGQLVLLKSICQSQKAGLPVTCLGHWAKHVASHPHGNPVVSGMLSELSSVEAAVGIRASPSIKLSSIGCQYPPLSAAPCSIPQTYRSSFSAAPHLQPSMPLAPVLCLVMLPPAQQQLWCLIPLGRHCFGTGNSRVEPAT